MDCFSFPYILLISSLAVMSIIIGFSLLGYWGERFILPSLGWIGCSCQRDILIPCCLGTFYASAFRPQRHYVFGLSNCPSVQSLKYPILTYIWVRWSTRPTVTVLRHVRPSVRLSVHPSGEVSGHLPENAWRKWPEILHADVS